MCDCELPDIFESRRVKARKLRYCCECCDAIPPGTVYLWESGHWPGGIGWDHYTTCEPCAALRQRLQQDSDHCDCIPYGGIADELWECRKDAPVGRDGREFWRRMKRNRKARVK